MKINDMGKSGELLMKCKSDTTGEIYEVRKDGDFNCTCLGYQTSKKRPKNCKHIRRYKLSVILENFLLVGSQDNLEKAIEDIEQLFKKEV